MKPHFKSTWSTFSFGSAPNCTHSYIGNNSWILIKKNKKTYQAYLGDWYLWVCNLVRLNWSVRVVKSCLYVLKRPHSSKVNSFVASQPAVCRSVWTEESVWVPTHATAPPVGKACCARSVSMTTECSDTSVRTNVWNWSYHKLRWKFCCSCVVQRPRDVKAHCPDLCFYLVISQLSVNRSVCTGVDVCNQTSAPAGADTLALSAPGG